jgi:hypothetical protein
MNMMIASARELFLGLVLVLVSCASGCARSAGPLPGDSVSADGAVTLSSPRLSTAPPEARESHEGLGPIESRLFPPELVMEHQAELAITAEQKRAIVNETEKEASEMVRLQWELQGEKEKLVRLLDPAHVDDVLVASTAARLMEHETKVKSTHLAFLVRVKNLLTADQQAKLREVRTQARPLPPARPNEKDEPPTKGAPSAARPPPSKPRPAAPAATLPAHPNDVF